MWKLIGLALGHKHETPSEATRALDGLAGRVEIDFARCTPAGPCATACAEACPTPALRFEHDRAGRRATLALDLGNCVFCGLCEEACPEGAVRLSGFWAMAARRREDLVSTGRWAAGAAPAEPATAASEAGERLRAEVHRRLGRSLHVRVLDAGDCLGCLESAGALASPLHDLARWGIEFVASPRHADLLLVTGTITRALERPLLEARAAMPAPGLVVAAGACAIGGGIYHGAYGQAGGPPAELPVDVWIPGCPPRPQALLHGLRVAIGAVAPEQAATRWRGEYPAGGTIS